MGSNDPEETIYPLSNDDLDVVNQLCYLIRDQISIMNPDLLRKVAIALFALERLPKVSGSIQFTIGWMTPRNDGNYAWADFSISEEEISATIGERYYLSDMGGDTQSEKMYFMNRFGKEFGDLSEWFIRARALSEIGELTLSFDLGDDIIDFEEYD